MMKETKKRREDNLKWVLEFAQHPLPPVKSDSFQAMRARLKEIVLVEVIQEKMLLPMQMYKNWLNTMDAEFAEEHVEVRVEIRAGDLAEKQFEETFRLPTPAEVEGVHEWLNCLLGWNLRSFLPVRPAKELIRADTFERIWCYEDEDLYRESCVALLAVFHQSLRHCKEGICGKLFYRKGRKEFCSTLCGARCRGRRWYRKKNNIWPYETQQTMHLHFREESNK